jgi:hypothetical protein
VPIGAWVARTLLTGGPGVGPAGAPGISPRELDVLRLVARGMTDKQALGIASGPWKCTRERVPRGRPGAREHLPADDFR